MNLQERKDKADIVSKLIDSLYKKLIVLLAIDGAFGKKVSGTVCKPSMILKKGVR